MRSTTENNVRCPKKKSGEMGKTKEHYFDSLLEEAEMVPASFIPNTKNWTMRPVTPSGEVNTYALSCGGMDLLCHIHDAVSPFEPSSLADGPRKTLVLRLPPSWDAPIGEMEEALIAEVAVRSTELFGERQSEEALRAKYKPISKKAGEYPRNLRVKLNTSGYHAARFWDLDRKRLEAPAEYSGLNFSAMVRFRALWVAADSWGLVCDATDMQVLAGPVSPECPF